MGRNTVTTPKPEMTNNVMGKSVVTPTHEETKEPSSPQLKKEYAEGEKELRQTLKGIDEVNLKKLQDEKNIGEKYIQVILAIACLFKPLNPKFHEGDIEKELQLDFNKKYEIAKNTAAKFKLEMFHKYSILLIENNDKIQKDNKAFDLIIKILQDRKLIPMALYKERPELFVFVAWLRCICCFEKQKSNSDLFPVNAVATLHK